MNEHGRQPAEAECLQSPEDIRSEAEQKGVGNAIMDTRAKVAKRTNKANPEIDEGEETLLREALKYLLRHEGMLLVPTAVREERRGKATVWIFTVTLRYPTGHEGYVGDLLYDGKTFEFLTPAEERKRRAEQIAADPERLRKWNEYRDSTLPAGEG